MSRKQVLATCTMVIASFLAFCAQADDKPPRDAPQAPTKMKADEPMTTGMMKKGMKKGDVKRAAEKKAQKMQPMMEQEEKLMPPAKTKP